MALTPSSNFCSHHHFCRWGPLRKIAASTGARVSALKAEMAMENAMVRANWRNRIPVVPGKNATGTNTAQSTSEMAINVFNHDDSVVDDQASGEGDAEQGQRVDGETQQFHKDEGADERNRSGDEVNHRRPPVAEKDKDHQDDQKDRRTYRVDYVADRLPHSVGGVEGDFVVHSRREFF